jgi:hypothetical protein
MHVHGLRRSERPDPVLPTELDLDNLDGLIGRMVGKVLEQNTTRHERDVKRAWKENKE